MSSGDLKIQLEGKYELVEAASVRLEAGLKALRRGSWATKSGWSQLKALSADELAALAALKHKAADSGSAEGLALAERVEAYEDKLAELLRRRLKAFGIETGGNIEDQVARLAQQLPVAFEYDQRPMLRACAIALGLVGTTALVSSWNPITLLILVLGAAIFVVAHVFADRVLVTRRTLLLNDLAAPLPSVAHVAFDYGGRSGCTVDATTLDGAHRQLLIGARAASRLAKTLRAHGVEVRESR